MGALDLVYIIAGLVVPTATVVGLYVWFVRSRRAEPARSAADRDTSELARSVAVVQQRLTELTGQLETMGRDWEERDHRLTGQLNALLALTERPRGFDLSGSVQSGSGQSGSVHSTGDRPSARRSSRP